MKGAYYNEFDPKAAAWLRELIKAGHIAPGEVDERDIKHVKPDDLNGFTQCHFFAGIGGWSLALRLAGWPDDREVWTGSCPCQPFSNAGKRSGKKDPRHLWPEFFRLIKECRPAKVFGEQVASKDGRKWLAGVFADLEGVDYAVAGADLCAAGIRAPHIRQRLWWMGHAASDHQRRNSLPGKHGQGQSAGRSSRDGGVAHTTNGGCRQSTGPKVEVGETGCESQWGPRSEHAGELPGGPEGCGGAGRLANTECAAGRPGAIHRGDAGRQASERAEGATRVGECGAALGLEHTAGDGREQRRAQPIGGGIASGCSTGRMEHADESGRKPGQLTAETAGYGTPAGSAGGIGGVGDSDRTGRVEQCGPQSVVSQLLAAERASGGFWSDFDLIPCASGKARRIESGTFPLAHGIPGRVGLLRGYGNAIVPEQAAEFIMAAAEAMEERS